MSLLISLSHQHIAVELKINLFVHQRLKIGGDYLLFEELRLTALLFVSCRWVTGEQICLGNLKLIGVTSPLRLLNQEALSFLVIDNFI